MSAHPAAAPATRRRPRPGRSLTPGRSDDLSAPSRIPAAIAALQGFARAQRTALDESEASALSLLYERYSGMVLTVCRRLLDDEDEAEDVLHDVYVRLPWTIARYRDAHFGGWLRQVATRTALMRLRGRGRSGADATMLEAGDAAIADRELAILEQRSLVRKVVAELAIPLREVVVLRLFLDLRHDEIAGLLGISRCASEVRLCRALKQLRCRLREQD